VCENIERVKEIITYISTEKRKLVVMHYVGAIQYPGDEGKLDQRKTGLLVHTAFATTRPRRE
jgi:hypothetical protein